MTEKKTNGQTELVFILDRSGSMSGLESDTIGGFNGMLAQHRSEGGDVLVSTVLFDHEHEVVHDRVRIADVPALTSKEYYTRGCTALLDAMGDAIHHIKNVHKYARPEDRPARTMFIITTDGMENSSTRYTADQVRAMVKQQEEAGWAFVWVKCRSDGRRRSASTSQRRRAVAVKEALINSALPSWHIFSALSVSTNPPHSPCYASGLSP